MGIGFEMIPEWEQTVLGSEGSPARQLVALGFRMAYSISYFNNKLGFVSERAFRQQRGVYAKVYPGGDLLYVGETSNLPERMGNYARNRRPFHVGHRDRIAKHIRKNRQVERDDWCFTQFVFVFFLPENKIRQAALVLDDRGVLPVPVDGITRKAFERVLIGDLAPRWNKKGKLWSRDDD